jgi:predicted HTH transcriptional regulator
MTLSALKYLVAQGEGQYLEFKKKADHPEKIVRELVAFANSGGGTLLLGVSDNGQIPGLRFPDEEAYVMEAAIAQYAKPKLEYQLLRIKCLLGTEVLLYKVHSGEEKPYFWLAEKENQRFRVYVRSRDQTLQASREMYYWLKFRPDPMRQKPFALRPMEQMLLQYFSDQTFITIDILAQIGKISPRKSAQFLLDWAKQGVLRIEPGELQDRYFLQEGFRYV